MSIHRFTLLVLALAMALSPAACKTGPEKPVAQYRPERIVYPPGVAGTISEVADLVGADAMPVRGYGVVVGLGTNGSSEVPPTLQTYLDQQMRKYYIGSATGGSGALTPARILADKDTAVVLVSGRVPPAAPKGTRFDVVVESLPQTQTLSLDGGVLMGTEMSLAVGEALGTTISDAKTWALAKGPVFVNPFVERKSERPDGRMRAGMVPGGGVVTTSQDIRLELRQGDYRIANIIQRRINQRFGTPDFPVASAKSSSLIEVQVPPMQAEQYEHFLRLVMHVYLQDFAGDEERYARFLTEKVVLPTAHHEDIALAWEAMGRQVLPIIQPLYVSDNPAAAYYAARTGLRLGDGLAVEPMIGIATKTDSPFQIPAIGELGAARKFIQVVGTLKGLLGSSNELLRVAAYEALLVHGAVADVTRVRLPDQFVMDVVRVEGEYTIYATRTGAPRIVLFGDGMPVRLPVFYCAGDELVTLNANNKQRKISAYRKMPGTGEMSKPALEVDPTVKDLVKTLGTLPTVKPDGSVDGLGLTYSQVLGVLNDLCKAGHIPGKFVLQTAPEIQRIYLNNPAVDRPDMPDEENR